MPFIMYGKTEAYVCYDRLKDKGQCLGGESPTKSLLQIDNLDTCCTKRNCQEESVRKTSTQKQNLGDTSDSQSRVHIIQV